jgi:short-subunit dehydrogenase
MNVHVITGASDGIGAEMARQLATAQGQAAALVLAARSQDKLQGAAHWARRPSPCPWTSPTSSNAGP